MAQVRGVITKRQVEMRTGNKMKTSFSLTNSPANLSSTGLWIVARHNGGLLTKFLIPREAVVRSVRNTMSNHTTVAHTLMSLSREV